MWKNLFIRFLATLLSKPYLPKKTKNLNLLVVSTTGLGDSLWATASIESLKTSFPESSIAILTSPTGKEVFQNNPYLDAIYEVKRPIWKRFFSLRKTLCEKQFDHVLLFHASDRLIFLLSASLGAKELIGTKGINKGLDFLFTKLIAPAKEHEIIRRLKIIEAIGAKSSTETLSFYGIEKENNPTIVIHPGAKDSFKRWSIDHFITVAAYFQKEGFRIIVTGSEEEKELLEKMKQELNLKNYFIDLTLIEFANILKDSSLLITNDTGPFHLASAIGTKALAIFGPTDPDLCGPYQAKKSHLLKAKISCSPCLKRKCPLPFCLLEIGPQKVIEKACAILKSS